jgi:hypothetical protein
VKKTIKPRTAKEIEESIRYSIVVMQQYDCIKPDGFLDESFILTSIINHNLDAALEYRRFLSAYANLRKNDAVIKGLCSGKVSEETLKNLILTQEALVRPLKAKEATFNRSVYYGKIIKLPLEREPYREDGESWKSVIEKKREYDVDDKVLYTHKTDIIMDNELLHLVCSFSGKLLK